MPESTPSRRSERKRAAKTRFEDEVSPTQTRIQPASRKRKVSSNEFAILNLNNTDDHQASSQHTPSRRQKKQKSPDEEVVDAQADDSDGTTIEDDAPEPEDIIDEVIQCLEVPDYTTNAQNTYNNKNYDGEERIDAFAKLSGREWTYYVQQAEIILGRLPAPFPNDTKTGSADPSEDVDIDLGPNKLISRGHAMLKYDEEDEYWYIHVHGRNGITVDNVRINPPGKKLLKSGTILAIGGTEILFTLPKTKPEVDGFYLERIQDKMEETLPEARPTRPIRALPVRSSPTTARNGPGGNSYLYHPYALPVSAPNGQSPEAPVQYQQATQSAAEPSTPKRSGPGSAKRKSPGLQNKGRGIMMESTENIDYSHDSAKDLKPSCSYASLITWAILSTKDEALTLNGIYEWIKTHYAFYRLTSSGWQNSIRHNLSLNPAFYKTPRGADEPGKGMKWRLVPESRDATIKQANKNISKGGGRISSVPGSPAGTQPLSSGFISRQMGFLSSQMNGEVKSSPRAATPPLAKYPTSYSESNTPTRAPQMPDYSTSGPYAPTQAPLPVFASEASPPAAQRRRNNAMDSSPTLTTGAWTSDPSMRTPMPQVHNLAPPMPNTMRNPTSFLIQSSPSVEFYRFNQINGTPRYPVSSPFKNGVNEEPVPQSSSPPPTASKDIIDSPTRKPKASPLNFGASLNGANGNGRGVDGAEDDDEEEIDLAK
ncbi:transcription factor [Puttea exsequens]|nr:transcription factor [Puttea exsequens]